MKNFLKFIHHGCLCCLIGAIFVTTPATIFFPDIYSSEYTMDIIIWILFTFIVSYTLSVILYAERRG